MTSKKDPLDQPALISPDPVVQLAAIALRVAQKKHAKEAEPTPAPEIMFVDSEVITPEIAQQIPRDGIVVATQPDKGEHINPYALRLLAELFHDIAAKSGTLPPMSKKH